jgi:hypothetical protein
MNKSEQMEYLKKSIKKGFRNEIESFIQSISTKEVFEYHLIDDYENEVYDKLSESEIDDILSEVEKTTELNFTLKFN